MGCSGGVGTENMGGKDEAAYISSFKLHVTGAMRSRHFKVLT